MSFMRPAQVMNFGRSASGRPSSSQITHKRSCRAWVDEVDRAAMRKQAGRRVALARCGRRVHPREWVVVGIVTGCDRLARASLQKGYPETTDRLPSDPGSPRPVRGVDRRRRAGHSRRADARKVIGGNRSGQRNALRVPKQVRRIVLGLHLLQTCEVVAPVCGGEIGQIRVAVVDVTRD